MMEIKEQIQKVFSERFGDHGTMYTSAGRINLIGEHTDYNGGFGGCTINLIKNELLEPFVEEARTKFAERYGHEPKIYEVVISDGARKIQD